MSHAPRTAPEPTPPPRLTGAQGVRLVAEREIRTRLRSKTYRITTLVLILLVVAFAVVMKVVGSRSSVQHVGFVPGVAAVARVLPLAAEQAGVQIRTQQVADEAAGRQLVTQGRLDALVTGVQGSTVRVVVEKDLNGGVQAALTRVAAQASLDAEISRLGGDPGTVAARIASAQVSVEPLAPPTKFDPQRLAVGSVAGILIYLALLGTGTSVAQGVVEEKASRVVELLLATIRPWQLMAGKVLGIGLVGLLQVFLVGVAGVAAGKLTGAVSLSLSTTLGSVVWLVVWFVLGFTMYALVFAGLGALVSRQEDVGAATAPTAMLLVIGYVVGISVLPNAPDNAAVAVLSLVPAFAPTLMPMRLAMGPVPWWQVLTSLALAGASVPLLLAITGRIYRNGVVRTGARVRLRDALRSG